MMIAGSTKSRKSCTCRTMRLPTCGYVRDHSTVPVTLQWRMEPPSGSVPLF